MHLRPRLRAPAPLGRVILLVTLAALSGCDYPTAAPLIDVRWVFPIDDQSLSVVELLPAGVDTVGGSFAVDVDPFTLNQTLGVLCPDCIPLNGQTVPTPPFNFTYNEIASLPTDVVSVEMESALFSLGIQNDLGFDPLRPAATRTGTMTITVFGTDINGDTLAIVVLDGATDALPNGMLTTVPVILGAGTATSTILTVIDLDSPLGDTPVPINVNNGLGITATVGTVLVSSATVNVDNLTVDIDEKQLELEDIDEDFVSNIQIGALVLDVQNPFGVAISLVVEIGGGEIICEAGDTPPCTLKRTLDIGSGPTSSATLSYTGAELQTFLGKTGVFFRGSGTVMSPGGPLRVTPDQVLVIEATLDVELEIGG